MSEKKTEHFYEEGNDGFIVAELNDDGTYGEVLSIDGLIAFDGTIDYTISKIAADNDPSYITRETPAKCEGTITFAGLSFADYEKLYNNIKDSNGALVFGREGSTKKVGISFVNTKVSKNIVSQNKFSFANVVFKLPSISTQTVKEDDETIRAFEVSFTASSMPYMRSVTDDTGAETGKVESRWVASTINSEDNKDIWDKVKDRIYVPDMDVSELI